MTGPIPTTENVPEFPVAMRGYERRQVDEYVAGLVEKLGRMRTEIAEGQRKLRLATEHAEATERELREARNRPAPEPAAPTEEGFGFRAEKLLRMAEQEATELRANASREASGIVEKARTEAEQHRHEVEQSLISRASAMEQQAAQRASELQDREQQIADQLAAAREQADELHANAARAAERLRQESEAAAEETRKVAEQAARRREDKANQEVERLTAVQADVRAELSRLAGVLGKELGQPAPAPREGSGSVPGRRGAHASQAAAT
ncbi:hypothetical protein ACFQ34_12360 [Pseudonocardia benzenivorans]|uniref:DivIVA protein n=1 Tax=Pseudonocardia benzenivorans TaxID=228005 RepID=A0ABW3VGB9_9PSEU|nr:hypothetical protein [Pseudonocardia dioxanivorans]